MRVAQVHLPRSSSASALKTMVGAHELAPQSIGCSSWSEAAATAAAAAAAAATAALNSTNAAAGDAPAEGGAPPRPADGAGGSEVGSSAPRYSPISMGERCHSSLSAEGSLVDPSASEMFAASAINYEPEPSHSPKAEPTAAGGAAGGGAGGAAGGGAERRPPSKRAATSAEPSPEASPRKRRAGARR